MKLIRCHIENFGKLSNFDYEFQSGLNTIKEKNGFGKTTFASFIKAMFYGMETKRNTKQLLDRKKYNPWKGGNFGGSVEFEINNKKYKLERFFGKKEVDDIFNLYDLDTNLETSDFTQNIGEEIFKLNKEAYERSTFISGQNMETSANDSISAKLGNVLESENDVNTSKKAITILDEAIKTYKKTGGRGELNEKLLQKTELEKKIEQSKIDEISLKERKKQNEELKLEIKSKEAEKENYQKKVKLKIEEDAKLAKQENYNILKRNVLESKKAYEDLKNNVKEESDIKEKVEYNKNKVKKLTKEIAILEKNVKKDKFINILLFIISAILIVIGTLRIIKKMPILFLAFGIIVAIIFIIRLILLRQKRLNLLNNKQEKVNLDNLIETLNSLYLKDVETKNADLERLKNDYEQKLKMQKEFELNNDINSLNNKFAFDESMEDMEIKINILNKQINKLNDQKNYNKNQIEILESKLDEVTDIENELEDLVQKIEQMRENYEILEKTKKYLEKAKEQFSSHYLKDMQDSFAKNIRLINGENISSSIDVNLNVKLDEQGSQKELKYFSTGYQDLIYICMRLSLIQALFKEEKPFIILDDPFVNLDEEKIENAIYLLNNLSKSYQIIYFICHESRK